MPEGPQVARWIASLQALVGEPLLEVHLPKRWQHQIPELLGQTIVSARAHGKHMLLELSGGLTLHCHALLYGSWQVGAPGMELRKPERLVRVRLRTPGHEAVFYNGPIVELLTPAEATEHHALPKLGPDLLHERFDRDEAAHRAVAAGDREVGDVVLDQAVMAGIGNIYKSEGLFLAGIHPRRPASGLSRAEWDRLWDVLVPIMQAASLPGGRMIRLPPEHEVAGHRKWVYRRRGKPCLRCGTPIEMIRQGQLQRMTFFCPRCQPLNPPPQDRSESRSEQPAARILAT
jgi:DNA-formamidopyrimidine glycosylase